MKALGEIFDRAILEFDRALRAVAGVHHAERPNPAGEIAEADLDASARAHSGALMRVNHVGEVCAQALYQGQAWTARNPATRDSLDRAAREEADHLAWSADRLRALGARPSLLNPVWYAGSLALGAAAGLMGDRWSLAFLAETEHQVEEHLSSHLRHLAGEDARTRAVVKAMRDDEARHRQAALALGAAELPLATRRAMRAMAKLMTAIAYRV